MNDISVKAADVAEKQLNNIREHKRKKKRDEWEQVHSAVQTATGAVGNLGKGAGGFAKFINDFSWYNQHPNILNTVVKTNTTLPIKDRFSSTLPYLDIKYIIDNIPNDSLVDLGAQEVFGRIRLATNGRFNYTVHDVKTYMIIMGNWLKLYSHMTRIYGTLNYMSKQSAPELQAFEKLFGIHLTDLPLFRNAINRLGVLINTYTISPDVTYWKRALWIYSGLFKLGDSVLSPKGMFMPHSFLSYVDSAYIQLSRSDITDKFEGVILKGLLNPITGGVDNPGSAFVSIPVPNSLDGYVKLIDDWATMGYNSGTISIIAADFGKLFTNKFALPDITYDYIVPITDDINTVNEFLNARGIRNGSPVVLSNKPSEYMRPQYGFIFVEGPRGYTPYTYLGIDEEFDDNPWHYFYPGLAFNTNFQAIETENIIPDFNGSNVSEFNKWRENTLFDIRFRGMDHETKITPELIVESSRIYTIPQLKSSSYIQRLRWNDEASKFQFETGNTGLTSFLDEWLVLNPKQLEVVWDSEIYYIEKDDRTSTYTFKSFQNYFNDPANDEWSRAVINKDRLSFFNGDFKASYNYYIPITLNDLEMIDLACLQSMMTMSPTVKSELKFNDNIRQKHTRNKQSNLK